MVVPRAQAGAAAERIAQGLPARAPPPPKPAPEPKPASGNAAAPSAADEKQQAAKAQQMAEQQAQAQAALHAQRARLQHQQAMAGMAPQHQISEQLRVQIKEAFDFAKVQGNTAYAAKDWPAARSTTPTPRMPTRTTPPACCACTLQHCGRARVTEQLAKVPHSPSSRCR